MGRRLFICRVSLRGSSPTNDLVAAVLPQQIQPLVISSYQSVMMDDNIYIDTPPCAPDELIALRMNVTVCACNMCGFHVCALHCMMYILTHIRRDLFVWMDSILLSS